MMFHRRKLAYDRQYLSLLNYCHLDISSCFIVLLGSFELMASVVLCPLTTSSFVKLLHYILTKCRTYVYHTCTVCCTIYIL